MGEPLTLLYDGLCPVCAREIGLLRRLDRRGRLAFEDIAAPSFDPARHGLTMAEVVGSMHAVEPDGTVVTGVEVFRRAYAAVGLGWVLAPTRWPVVRPLADAAYRLFARVRPRLSAFDPSCAGGRCGVGGRAAEAAATATPGSSSATGRAPAPGR